MMVALRAITLGGDGLSKSTLREVKLLFQLRHANIVRLLEIIRNKNANLAKNYTSAAGQCKQFSACFYCCSFTLFFQPLVDIFPVELKMDIIFQIFQFHREYFKQKIIQNWVQIISPCNYELAGCHVTWITGVETIKLRPQIDLRPTNHMTPSSAA